MKRRMFVICVALFAEIATAFEEDFSNKNFYSGIPEHWSVAEALSTSNLTFQDPPSKIEGRNVLTINCFGAWNGQKIICHTNYVDNVACDNICVKIPVYYKKDITQLKEKIDQIQAVVSVDDGKSFIDIGNPIDLEEINRKENGWVTNQVNAYINGLSTKNVLIGLKVIAAGSSMKTGYVGGLRADFVASATPTDVKFVTENQSGSHAEIKTLDPGAENARISVNVKALPEGALSSTNVFAIVKRDGVETEMKLSNVDGTDEYVSEVISPALDAGEEFSVSIHTAYTTYELPTLGVQDVNKVAHEHAIDAKVETVAKLGSFWINEAVLDADGLAVEFAGTANRVMTTGWKLVLSNDTTEVALPLDKEEELDFKTNLVNGVIGLDVRRFSSVVVADGTYWLKLINSRGHCECAVEVDWKNRGFAYGLTGIATWNKDLGYSYDWSGTGTKIGTKDAIFGWHASGKSTVGQVNDGQGFRVPFSTTILVTTVSKSGSKLPYAAVTILATNVENVVESTESTFSGQTSAEGLVEIPLEGFSCETSQIPVTVSALAFGWEADELDFDVKLAEANSCLVEMSRAVAYDDCDSIQPYWDELDIKGVITTRKTWATYKDGSRNVLRLNLVSAGKGTNSIMQCKNSLSAEGKKYVAVSFDFKNTYKNSTTDSRYNELCVSLTTNETWTGAVLDAVVVSNKRSQYGDYEWYTYKGVVELPDGFRESDLSLRILSRTLVNSSSAYVYLDNLRIAFQDVALPTELERSIEVPENGQNVDFTLNVLPQTTGTVERVSADLHVEKNGVAEVVPLAFADGGLTNDLSAADGAVQAKTTLGPFLVGDTVTYYAAVHYDSDDADDDPMDVRYFPDNSYINDKGSWIVEGDYGVNTNLSAYTFTVDGPALSIVGDPETTTNGVRFTVHGYSANTLTNITVWINGEECKEQPFDFLSTNGQIRVTGDFVIEKGLNASTTYSVKITGVDGKGNILDEATFDFLTKPKMPDISGTPEDGAYSPTKAFDFYALAEADDVTKLNFHWLLDEAATKSGNGETNYTDTVEADGPHTVRVYVTDGENNVSPTNSLSWVVDTHVPTNLAIRGWPADGAVTNVTAYKLFAEAKDATSLTFIWTLNADRVEVVTNDFSGDVAAGFSTNTVSVVAKDAAGNTSTTGLTWIVDTVAPTNLTFKGRPANGTVTKDPTYRLMATALDDMERTYHWLLEDGTEVTTAEDAYLDREVDGDGKHAVRYYATDKAGNSSVTNTLSWTVDRKAPTGVKILGAPVGDPAVTNKPTLSLSAVADKDLTTITYHWLTNGVAAVTATNFEVTVTRDGAFTVSCYATDEAQNVSETNSVSWILDTVAPTVPILTDVLENGVVTSNKAYTFSAAATDLTRIDFAWVLSGGETGTPTRDGAVTGEQTGGYYGNVKADGVYTITVFAKDAAGNGPVSTNWTWTVDTTPPRIVGMDATPDEGDVVATNGFDFTVFMADATELTYRWVLNGVTNGTCTTSNYVDTAAIEGTNTVSVFAEDAAHNVCEPTNLTWVVDLHSPTNVTIHGWPMGKGTVITNGTDFAFTATAEDDTALRFFWSLNGGEVMEKAVFTSADAKVREETNTVSVYAKDEAGNVSETNSWSWIVDTTPPVIKALIGKPENGELTNDPMFDFKVLATDKTAITYYWSTNNFAVSDNFTSNLVGRAIEGTNTVSVYVEDAAHNFSVTTNTVRWTLDTIHPTVKLSTETDEKHIINATEDFFVTAKFSEPVTNFTAKSISVDNGSVVSIATNAEANVYVVKIAPKGDGPISVQIVENAVTDLAGNGNEPSTNDHGEQAPLTRTCDITLPGVSLSSSTPTYFNRKVGYMTVTVTFTEPVVGFTKDSLTIVTGQESWEVVSNEANKVFTVHVWPNNYSDEKYIGQEKITVNVLAGVVTDAAGNPNTAAAADLTKTYDTLTPTVDITSTNVPDPKRYFNNKPLLVTIVVSGSNVTELASSSVVVTNGTFTFDHTEKLDKQDIYKLEVTPLTNGVVTVLVPAGVVTNASQNVNEQPEPLVRIYDSEAPTDIRIDGTPETNKVVATTYFKFDAFARDNLMQPHELEYHWILNGESRDGTSSHYEGDVPKGTNWVSVYATDAAGNSCEPVRRTWVVDYLNPTNLVLTGTPALEDRIVVTTETNFNFVATAEDETRISYLWTTNGADVVDNLTTNLTGIAIEGTNVVTVTAMDEASNRWEYGEKVLTRTWVVDTLAPSNLAFVACTPKAGAVVATNGFSFTVSAQDATRLTYHWILNGVTNQTCTSANFVGTTALEGTNTVSVYAEDEAHNISAATNLTWVVDMTDPTGLTLSGTPPTNNIITNKPGFAFKAKATDKTRLSYHWTLNDAEVKGNTSSDFHGNGREGTNTVSVYAMDEASNTCAAVSRIWIVDTLAPTNLVVTGAPENGVVTKSADFAFGATAEDATAITYHWKTNDVDYVFADGKPTTNIVGTVIEGTNTVQIWAEDAAHNVCDPTQIVWVVDWTKPSLPDIKGSPARGAITNGTEHSFTATAEDKTLLNYYWTFNDVKDVEKSPGVPFTEGAVDEGTNTVYVYAIDEAGNVSPTNSLSWIVDRIAPAMPEISGNPTSNSFVNVTNFSFSAALPKDKPDATAVEYHWTLDEDPAETAVTNFNGVVGEDGLHTVHVYAKDAAGNVSPTNSLSWTVDTVPPVLGGISGTPAAGDFTNVSNYSFTVSLKFDDATPITNYWRIGESGAEVAVSNFTGAVTADGVYTVFVYAKDAAGNVSQTTNSLSWTYDATPPQGLKIDGTPTTNRFVVATDDFDFRASYEYDLTDVSYSWTLNGAQGSTTAAFDGRVSDGTNTVTVYAIDQACNTSAVSRTWVADTLPPTNRIVFAVPGNGEDVITNKTFFSIMALAEDATTQVEYCWTTNDIAVLDKTVTTNLTSWLAREGANTVTVYAKDEAGNVSETNTVRWTVDTIAPEVTLTSETSTNHVINMTDVLKVTATFTEPVVGFTDKSVTVSNGMVTNVVAKNEKVYEVWIAPAGEDVTSLSVQIAAGAVTDRAGNGNVASNELKYKCDVKPPRVVRIESEMSEYPFSPVDLDENDAFEVTIVFSEAVTNFTKSSVTVTNGTVISVSPSEVSATTYTVRVTPINLDEAEYDISIGIAAGVVNDLAGNGNEPSETLVCKYDYKPPTIPVVSGTPANGATIWGVSVNYSLTASGSTDTNGVSYYWQVLVDEAEDEWETFAWETNKVEDVVTEPGVYKLRVFAMDDALNPSEAVEWSWTLESGEPPSGVPFGDSVQLKISTPEVTNVVFTAVDFHPGADSTFALREFELINSQDAAKEITDLRMQFIVGTNLLDATRWPVKVENFAGYTNGTLTVRVLAEETTDKVTGKPYEELFIFGIDNQDLDK